VNRGRKGDPQEISRFLAPFGMTARGKRAEQGDVDGMGKVLEGWTMG